MGVMLMDCTLRDGANVVGKGFSAEDIPLQTGRLAALSDVAVFGIGDAL